MNTSTKSVQTVRPHIKVTDQRYGLKTAARIAYERRLEAERREGFNAARRDALAKERERVQGKLSSLRSEIRKLMAKLEAGTITGTPAIDEAFDKLRRMGQVEVKFESDINRISDKIGALL